MENSDLYQKAMLFFHRHIYSASLNSSISKVVCFNKLMSSGSLLLLYLRFAILFLNSYGVDSQSSFLFCLLR